ncbi:hypothetical protein PDE_08149 [Penicillium oxalicum 114-2]|uniref:Uncharacterized protein n=1 Tax=Penicillium oxalicum (strain 114-2 / CGMCC 5302) TaxID=933388 RepID=S8BDS6_PENO1|nr:hypothetical protein PDE_08149 [Penicillium oxalicum 114-2]
MEAVVQSIIHVVHHGSAEAEFQGRVLLFPTLEALLEAADSTSNARQGLPRRSWLSRYKVHTQSILWIQPLRYDPFLAHFSLRTSLNPKRRTRRKGLVELDKTSVTVRPLWNRDGSRPTLSVVMRVGNRLHPWYGQASLQQSQTGNARPLHLEGVSVHQPNWTIAATPARQILALRERQTKHAIGSTAVRQSAAFHWGHPVAVRPLPEFKVTRHEAYQAHGVELLIIPFQVPSAREECGGWSDDVALIHPGLLT